MRKSDFETGWVSSAVTDSYWLNDPEYMTGYELAEKYREEGNGPTPWLDEHDGDGTVNDGTTSRLIIPWVKDGTSVTYQSSVNQLIWSGSPEWSTGTSKRGVVPVIEVSMTSLSGSGIEKIN